MKFPTLTESVFSLKCLLAALLALFVAMYFDLPKPFWAMMTSYIVANPFSGPVRSKAIYRALGTILGSAVTLLIVPGLVQAPELLSLVMALWVGVCLFLSLLDRTPRAYVFMLAGYTAALIGFPAVSDASHMFDAALARVEEIMIGICSASLVHSLVWPQSLGPAMMGRLRKVLQDTRHYMNDVFAADLSQGSRDRRLLAADIAELRIMASHLPFDTSHLRWTAGVIYQMHGRLAFILPLLSGAADRLQQLERFAGSARCARWSQIAGSISEWIKHSEQHTASYHQKQRETLLQQIENTAPRVTARMDWPAMLEINLATRLRDLVQLTDDVLAQHASIAASFGGQFPMLPVSQRAGKRAALRAPEHYDYGLAALSALAAVAAILACCSFWIASAWSAGAVAAMMAAVFCCFFAVQDDPVPSIKGFLTYTLLSVPISAAYVIWLMPAVHYFETLALALAPMLFVLGIFLARPASAPKAIAMVMGILGSLALQERQLGDLPGFLNSTIAQVVGVIVAVVSTALLRTVSTGWRARRLLRAGRLDLLDLLTQHSLPEIEALAARMLDRVAQLTPRLALLKNSAAEQEWQTVDAMQDCRIGLNIAQLLRCQSELHGAGIQIEALLQQLRQYLASIGFDHVAADQQQRDVQLQASQQVCLQIDLLLAAIAASPQLVRAAMALTALVGIRRDICPDSAAYQGPALAARSAGSDPASASQAAAGQKDSSTTDHQENLK